MSRTFGDLTGKTFGYLIVLQQVESIRAGRQWLCKCTYRNCNNEKIVITGHLISGRVKSCGCLKFRSNAEDLTGKTFGFLTVIKRSENGSRWQAKWLCRCNFNNCRNFTIVAAGKLKNGQTKSCGCFNRSIVKTSNITHGLTYSFEYSVWCSLKSRCFNLNNNEYHRYGGRGITVCDRWKDSFENFYKDMGARPESNLSIDRINNEGHYEPGNCRWTTVSEQALNRRLSPKNKTGIKGVCIINSKYQVQIKVNQKNHYLGYVKTLNEAKQLRIAGEIKYLGKQLTF